MADLRASDPGLAAEVEDLVRELRRLTRGDTRAGRAVARGFLRQVLDGERVNYSEIRREVAKQLGGRRMRPSKVTDYVDEYCADVRAVLELDLRRR